MNITIKPFNHISSQIIKVNRIGNKIISKEKINIKGLNINGALHSIIFEEKLFTNCVKSYEKKIYKEIKEIFDELYFGKASIDDKFILLSNERENRAKEERLEDIIKESLNINKVPSLMKFKPKHKKSDKTLDGVRIYVYYDINTEEFDLYLIDLYHLGIDGYNDNLGKYDLKNRYKVNSENKKCISKIADDYV